MAAPRFDRPLILIEPGDVIRSETGQRIATHAAKHIVRGARRDLPLNERLSSGLSLSEQVTRFSFRRGELPSLPTSAWKLTDERSELYDVVSVDLPDGRRLDDPQAVVTLLCSFSRESV